jgi:hypothetical protein
MFLPAGGVDINATAGTVINFNVGVLAANGTLHSSPPQMMLFCHYHSIRPEHRQERGWGGSPPKWLVNDFAHLIFPFPSLCRFPMQGKSCNTSTSFTFTHPFLVFFTLISVETKPSHFFTITIWTNWHGILHDLVYLQLAYYNNERQSTLINCAKQP